MINAEVVTKALTMLEVLMERKPSPHKELVSQAAGILGVLKLLPQAPDFQIILNEVVCRYESNVGVKTFDPDILIADPLSDTWFNVRRGEERPYFERYRRYLRQSGWDAAVLDNLELNCEKTLSQCADPHIAVSLSEAKKRGMVMGDVQAGKTANYLGVINMACDYGYRVIVLLAGLTDSLRKQTQERVDLGFIGAYSNSIGGMIQYIGVGVPDQQYHAIPLTNGDYDFAKFIQKRLNAAPTDFNKPVILVIKKHTKILESVHKWLKPGEHNISGDSILIIDDEADNASVNTKKPEYDPSAVNRRIRDIYNNFPIASYIGFTATPFANIFINPFDVNEEDQDLFPADFIIQLNAPDIYFGGEKVFPDDGSISPAIRVLDTAETDFIPVKHKKDLYVNVLPDSLKEAVLCFLINNVVRTLRGDQYKHRSMMINVSPLNDPQESIRNAVDAYVNKLKNIIEQDSYKSECDFITNADMNRLYKIYMKADDHGSDFYAQIRSGFNWVDIQRGLWEEIKQFETAIINNRYRGNLRYDYSAHAEQGSRVIVIGGFVLSRGLTLEGLCVSYYSRSATAYDTLLQMCRWFGYRPRYEDLCRIFLSQASINSFSAVMDAIRDLKEQFREMELQCKTPREFGLMVKESPAALETTMLVTARNKMHHTQVLEHYVNYGGVYTDTSKLFKDAGKNRTNNNLLVKFFTQQQVKGIGFSTIKNRCMLQGVSSADVADLLQSIAIPSVNKRFDSASLATYIRESPLFQTWDVVVATGESNQKIPIPGQELQASERVFHLGSSDENFIRLGGSNNRIIDPGIFDSGVDITQEKKQEILSKKKKKRSGKTSDQLTAKDWLKLRERPLLAIYYIDLKIDGKNLSLADREKYVAIKTTFGSDFLVGFAVGFPARDSKVMIQYRVNSIKAEELNSYEEEFDEEELSDE
ncbi:hypothetical protein C4J81_15755 [Deltaproteobacteria bacterium Smac51]|nr:hypothetical protein C4J81_15755 [Deltaproteobacteria bacterium Smac51]